MHYPLFETSVYQLRRRRLRELLPQRGLVFFPGNGESPMNYPHNTYPFRQDSTFLYFTGLQQPDLGLIMDLSTGADYLIGDDATLDDLIWTGPVPCMAELAELAGIAQSQPFSTGLTMLEQAISRGRPLHYLPPYRQARVRLLADLLGRSCTEVEQGHSVVLIEAVIALRNHKSAEEVAQMEEALHTTQAMHLLAMQETQQGWLESDLAGRVEGIAIAGGGRLAYPCIATVHGEILHNHAYHHRLAPGQLLLLDAGSSSRMHYASDITRTYPVASSFTTQQAEIYAICLEAQRKAVAALRPGVPFKEVHLLAAKTIARGLKELGLMKGDPAEAVAAGAHALFFPHGLGHLIGLDVHDMEDLGEDRVGYGTEMKRSTQFGTSALRLGRSLEEGFTLTVEPGIYFIPALMDRWQAQGQYRDFIIYSKLAAFREFGGIRIEDNYLITDSGSRLLGPPIPKTLAEIESLRS
ncbi:MAG: M24 family metallopeptidase [Bacteroidetes bacterium]|nr:MAG: M24 family metallopeptidase [Bacteroidota bacterium]